MYLENFVTYDQCEVYPGPYMNMLMGPNGTGKSSVVAAMALGLGWPASVLGRSKDAGEFVKYGRERAVLEIVLRVDTDIELGVEIEVRGDGVVVVRRELGRRNGKHTSEWFVNGNPSTARVVAQIMRELNVQVDNLCQFLPQDKVSEFAKLTPVELLVETEKAAAGPGVHEQHEKLIELRAKEKEIIGQSDEQSRRLANLRKHNENVEGLIQRIQQHEEHLTTIKLLEKKRPWLVYNSARDAYLEAKDVRNAARTQLEQAEGQSNPLRTQLKEKQDAVIKAEKKHKKVSGKADSLKGNISDLLNEDLPTLSTRIGTSRTQILKMREQKIKRETAIAELRRHIRQLEEEIAAGCPHEETDPFRSELNEVARLLNTVENEKEDADKEMANISKSGERLNTEINNHCAKLRQLEDVKEQRLEIVKRMSPDVFSAYKWVQENRSAFKDVVHGPICVDLNVREPSIARQVESMISKGNLLNFVVTNYDDCEVFMHQVERNGWKANVTVLEDLDISQARIALDRGDLKRLGFLGTVLDFIDGPDAVLAALVDIAKVHLIPIAKGPVDAKGIEKVRMIQKYATSEGSFESRRSNYSDEVATRCTALKNATFFSQSFSDDRKQKLVEQISQRRNEQSRNQERMKRLIQEKEKCEAKYNEHRIQKDKISEKRATILREIAEWKKKSAMVDLKRTNLQNLLQRNEENDGESEENMKDELRTLYKEFAETALEGGRKLEEYRELVTQMATEHLSIAKLEGETARLQEELRNAENQHETLRKTLAETEVLLSEKKATAKELLAAAGRSELDDETRLAFADLPESLDELDKLLAIERTRAEISGDSSVSATAVYEYEARKEEISVIERSLAILVEEMSKLQEEMEAISVEWIPALERMISLIDERFSAFFTQMHCAGQVRLAATGSDYDKYSLEILVKFRDNESLQVLSAQRQSGGEKSVSTILYLLALQELARSPFRVVDEINQGMDANNERRVHSLIVETATRAAKSQYDIRYGD
ncbi:Smc5 DNA repair [Paramicrosporidium saccamoebae]|uniref:Structural maintenance of chromosomes protein 5 n=1 Tax=Paramicrosporidium saccamoebae TaxID=1246581 RepID=A0A2H9TH46_9FUNG|nr:Smc5 DNA repair [Paramicrosporidium saccamoebae]